MQRSRTISSLTALGIVSIAAAADLAGQPANDSAVAAAARERPVAEATRISDPPVIDGRLDEAAWREAMPLTGFVQREPREGAPVSERTEVRILFDDDALYIGAWLYDAEPARLVLGERRRDASLNNSDAFLIILDTYHDRQSGFVFGTNPLGIEYDGQVTGEGRGGGGGMTRQQGGAGGGFNLNWDGSWQVATSRDENGWYAEFRIPFATLRYASGHEQVWGLNFTRRIARKNEEAFWAPIGRQHNLYRLSEAGTLVGLEAPVMRTVTLIPYGLASAQRAYAVDPSARFPVEAGGDAKIGLTRGLTLDLTVNTDFAQVEVDEHQVNLTRFSLFFPEKRPFFLENAGLFAVGTTQSAQMFFSRRIGIDAAGQPVPIRAGGRLTGRAVGTDVGLLYITTGELHEGQGSNDYTVARVSRELPNRSSVGAIYTSRVAESNVDYNRTYAVDGRLGIGSAITFDGFAARTQTPGRTGNEEAYSISGDFRTADWFGRAGYHRIGKDFNPEVGFLPRRGYWATSSMLMHYFRTPDVEWLRELRPHVSYSVSYDTIGFKETARLHVDSHIQFENGAMFSPAFDWVLDGLQESFAIAPDVEVAPGTYSGWEAGWRFNTNPNAPLVLRSGIDAGSFLSGRRRGGFTNFELRRGEALAAELRLSHNRIRLPEGEFDVTLIGTRLGYSFSPNVFVQSLIQYSDQANQWSGNVRFGWLNTAGTGLFVVYNEAQHMGSLTGPVERALIVKFTRQFEFAVH